MNRIVNWLKQRERQLFFLVNHKARNGILDVILGTITHLGGATFTIASTLLLALFGSGVWRQAALGSLIALAVSHIPVAIVKRTYPRRRPYLVMPETRTGKNPLTDHSFPSGHSTAIFAVVVPIVATFPTLGYVLLPIAALVSLSRIYLGLHYPSDCIAGAVIGSGIGLLAVAIAG